MAAAASLAAVVEAWRQRQHAGWRRWQRQLGDSAAVWQRQLGSGGQHNGSLGEAVAMAVMILA